MRRVLLIAVLLFMAGLAVTFALRSQRVGSFGPTSEQSRWERRGEVLTATEDWEGLGILEPSVMYEDSTFKMWYRGGGLHGPDTAIGYATSADGLTWTKHASNPIFGNGVAGEADDIICPNVIKVDGTYILYYAAGDELRAATSLDGLDFTVWTVGSALALPTGATLFGNTTVWREGASSWHMYVDAYLPADDHWASYYATSTDGQSWTLGNGGEPMTSLQIAADGTYGSLQVVNDDPKVGGGLYQAWYHASTITGNTFSDIYRAYSSNKVDWTIVTPRPLLTHTGTGFETQQIADPHPLEVDGTSYLFFDADDNSTDIAAIAVATFEGTLAQLIAGG